MTDSVLKITLSGIQERSVLGGHLQVIKTLLAHTCKTCKITVRGQLQKVNYHLVSDRISSVILPKCLVIIRFE